MVFLFPFSSNAQEQVKRILVHTLLFSVVFRRNLTSFSPPSTHVFLLLLHLWFQFSFPPSLVVPANLLHTFFCHGLSYFQHTLTLFSFLGFKRDACSWIEGLLFEKEGGVLLHAVGQILGRSKGHALSLSPLAFIPP